MLMRERRLVLLCAVSLALHLLALGLLAPSAERAAGFNASPRLVVTLLPAASVPVALPASALAKPLPRVVAQRAPMQEPVPAEPPAIAQSTTPDAIPDSHQAATPAAEPATLTAAPISGAGWNALPPSQGEAPVQMPGRYRTRLPPSALLTFELTRSAPGQAAVPAGAALIDWRIGPGGYSLRVEGVAGALFSEGEIGDNGVSPASASETLADGALATTLFDHQARRIGFSGSARSVRLLAGSQDRASLLLQLAGMGLAEPEQIKDVLEFYVGAGMDAGVVRFQVLGPEPIDSALGTLASVHLMQLVGPGEARLEVWLAPGHHWLPVQLRLTALDGSVLTQRVSAISDR